MEEIVRMVHEILEDKKLSCDEYMQLCKICEKEDLFVKDFSKDKWNKYIDLDIEKGRLFGIQIDIAISVTYELCKKLFQK